MRVAEADAVARHPDFRIFAAMNPPTDFGKKELPPGIRTRFTELYVAPLTAAEDLQLVVLGALQDMLDIVLELASAPTSQTASVVLSADSAAN